MNIHINKGVLFLYSAFIIELLIFFSLRQRLGYIVAPVLFTVTGLAIALLPFFTKLDFASSTHKIISVKKEYIYSFFALLFLLFGFWAQHIFVTNPIDIKKSDIIPFIDTLYVDRFLNGDYVYALAPGLGYGNWTPNYLPMHWLPFVVSKLMGIDPRWIPLTFYFIASFIYIKFLLQKNDGLKNLYIKLALPIVFLFLIFWKQSNEIAHTVELLIASYYFILAVFLSNNHILGRSIGLMFTLLSRYAVVFYLPAALVLEWLNDKKRLFKELGWVLLFVSIFYIIPFLLKDTNIFIEGSKAYDIAAVGEWKGQAWQAPTDKPFQLFQGLGFASWGYNNFPGDLMEKIAQYKNILLLVSIIASLLLIVFVYKKHNKYPQQLLHLAALKVILTTVFAFVLVPYSYLFWSSLVVSFCILSNYNLFRGTK
ncbi:MAG: hypothetical protein SGJ10_05650 [Bacteroidota bacterium]|nr:hypothetical protein [Bacteroidota bacterium]